VPDELHDPIGHAAMSSGRRSTGRSRREVGHELSCVHWLSGDDTARDRRDVNDVAR
jgi:hypothetical protein